MKAIEIETMLGTLKVMPTEENKKALNTIACMLIHAASTIETPDDPINAEYREFNLKTLNKLRNNIHDALNSVDYYKGY